jgi:hypothetical protein
MAHGGRLAGKAEMTLNVTRGRHDTVFALVLAQVSQQFFLPVGEVSWSKEHRNCVLSNKCAVKVETMQVRFAG